MKTFKQRLLACFMAIIMLFSLMPISAIAAPASDIPKDMLGNVYLDALEYTGYDVQGQKDDGTIFIKYAYLADSSVFSNITYNTVKSGLETIAKSGTATGRAPAIAEFEASGLCCASYITYVYYNYMPNIAGIDTSKWTRPDNLLSAPSYRDAANGWVSSGIARKITFTQSSNGSGFNPSEEVPVGSLVIFKTASTGGIGHVAIYAGYYNGKHFITHTGNSRGPEISTIDAMTKGGNLMLVNLIIVPEFVEETGAIQVYKKDTNGKNLAGAYFTATNKADSSVQYLIGPTSSSGYAIIENVEYGDYLVKETVFPTNYRAYGQSQWNVTVTNTNNGLVTINAVNEEIPGTCQIVKTAEDGKVSGISFRISGNGVDKTVVTESNGKISIPDLKPGTYTVTESVPSKYEPQNSQTVTIVSGKTSTVTFNNTLRRGTLKITKTSEDGLVEGVKFKLSGTSLCGDKVEQYAVTNKNGIATFENVLISGASPYTVEEIETAARYIVPASQTAPIEWNKVTNRTFHNTLKKGSLRILKESEDGLVSGMKFRLTGTSLSGQKIDMTAVTDSSGIAVFENVLISGNIPYVVEEVDTAERYIVSNDQEAPIEWNKVTQRTFENKLKRGDLKVLKESEDGLVEGLKFRLTGTSFSGIKVDEYAITDGSGIAYFDNILMGTGYLLQEVNTPVKYVVPDSLNVDIEWNKVTDASVKNTLKKWRADICKKDSEKDTAQGNATLEGAIYGVYKGDTLIDTYTTDKNGRFTTEYYTCSDDYTIREISPSEGYLLDPTVYPIDCSADNYTVELNTEYLTVTEQVIKGKIAIIKHSDDGSTQVETPEEGATFEVFLKSAGSYDNAKDTERAILVCDEYGYADAELPYGIYTIKQVSGCEGKELIPAFDVYIKEDGQTYRYLINNATFKALVEIQKKDAETGKIIPAAGIGFRVRSADTGEYIVQHINYPTPTDIEIYYTDSTGKLMLPDSLPYGNYEAIEVKTCYGYVLDSKPISFKIDGTKNVVTVEKSNIAQKGTITVTKKGEVFSSVTEINGVYQPVYETKALEGAEYTITAIADVYTLDGTLRYRKDQIVDTIVTGADGTAKTKPLYLGQYEVKEKTAPYGMVLNTEPAIVELEYAGENVSITTESTEFHNERQKAVVELTKSLENDTVFDIGLGDEILSVKFGLYATADIVAADGKIIPKDGLVEIASCNSEGRIVFKTDIPMDAKMYVKEIATDEHYILNDTAYPIEFKYAGQNTATVNISVNGGNEIDNKIIYGTIVGKKLDEDGFTIAGATFGLFANDATEFTKDTAIFLAVSNEIGIFYFENVPFGKYIVREITPAQAFVLNETSYEVEITEIEEIIQIEVENEFIVGSVQTTKVDADYPENKLSGAVFEVYVDVDNDLKFNAEIDMLVGEMNETEVGIYRLDGLRYNGYFLYEKSAPIGFLKDDNYHYFKITTNNEIVIVENKAGVGFENIPIKGNATTTKIDAEFPENKLSGAIFEIYVDIDGNQEFNAKIDTLVGEMTEGEPGIYTINDLRYNGYFLYEKQAPIGFLKDNTYHYFEIRNNGETVTVENKAGVGFLDTAIKGSVQTVKVDADYPDNKLSGAVFEIYFDVDKNKEFSAEIDILIGEMTEIELGVYRMNELRSAGYFLHEKAAPIGYVLDEGYYYFEIINDGEIVNVANNVGENFINQAIKGNISILKKDATSGEVLSGVEFGLFDTNGNEIVRGITGDDGSLLFEGIRFGTYELRELTAKTGYHKNNEVITVEISENAVTLTYEITNKKIPDTLPPYTGDDTNIGLFIALMVISSIGLIVISISSIVERNKLKTIKRRRSNRI